MRKTLSAATVLLSFLSLSSPLFASREKELPSWVTEAATRSAPSYPGKVPAVVLLHERKVTIDSAGMIDTVTRHAVKILTHQGKGEAEAVEGYERGGRQVKSLRAWLVAPGGFVKTFDKASVEDLGAYSDELYNDYRFRRIRALNAEIGAVFVYESETEEKGREAQDQFLFGGDLPTIESRYSITVPAAWTVSGRILNHQPVSPFVDGHTYTWVLKNLPFREPEEWAPHSDGTAPLLAVDFQPAASNPDWATFRTWSDVSRWHTRIAAPQAEVTPEMAAKVRQLTTGLSSEYENVRAVARYVQQVRYVEIAMDLSNDGGVRPHPAPQVFSRQYGDCKDKANLMRALLKSAGIESYLVIIYSGDRTFVKKDWPSPAQFNHMILAVQLSQPANVSATLATPLGRLLLFDPTDDKTPLGDLPFYEQGSYALLCAGEKGDILQMPVAAPEANLLSETVDAALDTTGKLTASLAIDSLGQAARKQRGLYTGDSSASYKALMEHYLNYYVKGVAIDHVETHDSFDQNHFSASLRFQAQSYGQVIQSRLLVFTPAVVEPSAIQFPVVAQRSQPIVLNARVYRKQVHTRLPAGFAVDEMPSPFKAETSFARFQVVYRQEPSELVMEEELRTENVTLPATDYEKVKQFFDRANGADSQKAVLVKN